MKLRLFVGLFLGAMLQACASIFPSFITVNGTVLDATTGAPIGDAEVIALWNGHITSLMSGHNVCYHVERTRTLPDGTFSFQAKISYPSGLDYPPDANPDIVVFKRGFKRSLKKLSEERLHWSASGVGWGIDIEWASDIDAHLESDFLPAKNPVRYLEPSPLGRHERIRYLKGIADEVYCPQSGDSNRNVLPLIDELTTEAKALMVTSYDEYLVRWLEHWAELAKGNRNAVFPEPVKNSVFEAVRSQNIGTVERALNNPKADPNERGMYGQSALTYAANHGQLAIVMRLLGAGADPNLLDPEPIQSGPRKVVRVTALGRAVQGAAEFGKGNPAKIAEFVAIVEVLLNSQKICVTPTNTTDPARIAFEMAQAWARRTPEINEIFQSHENERSCLEK